MRTRRVTFRLEVELVSCGFILIPQTTVYEHSLIGYDSFDLLVTKLEKIGALYHVESVKISTIDGNADFNQF